MADRSPRPPEEHGGKPKSRASVERLTALRDVLTHAVEAEKEARKHIGPPKPGAGRTIGIVFVAVGLAVTVFSVVVRPEFIWGAKVGALAPAEQNANLRMSMFLLGQRIRAHRQTHGRLPAALVDVGAAPAGINYRAVSDSVFELTATEGTTTITLRSDAPPAAFLGDAARQLRGAAR